MYRVTDFYGEAVGQSTDIFHRSLTPIQPEETLYVEPDWSMLLTRSDGWKGVS